MKKDTHDRIRQSVINQIPPIDFFNLINSVMGYKTSNLVSP